MRKILPFSLNATAHGVRHTLTGWHRRLTNQPVNRYVEIMVAKGLPVEALCTGQPRHRNCPLCGYAIAVVTKSPGWCIQGCSATLVPRMLESSAFPSWFARFAETIKGSKEARVTEPIEGIRETHLQTYRH